MGDAGAPPIARLTKHDAERLLAAYDGDPIGALTVALRRVLDEPELDWTDLLAAAVHRRRLTDSERGALLGGDTVSFDRLAQELNEQRDLDPR